MAVLCTRDCEQDDFKLKFRKRFVIYNNNRLLPDFMALRNIMACIVVLPVMKVGGMAERERERERERKYLEETLHCN
jgi:hypothetical protein